MIKELIFIIDTSSDSGSRAREVMTAETVNVAMSMVCKDLADFSGSVHPEVEPRLSIYHSVWDMEPLRSKVNNCPWAAAPEAAERNKFNKAKINFVGNPMLDGAILALAEKLEEKANAGGYDSGICAPEIFVLAGEAVNMDMFFRTVEKAAERSRLIKHSRVSAVYIGNDAGALYKQIGTGTKKWKDKWAGKATAIEPQGGAGTMDKK
ncbi:MAG: hypothetical protein FWE53_00530 [Firmicutes bacterium]|nr:hypothetical protein [Bacillota bacterium]